MVDLATMMAAMRSVHMAATLSLLGTGGFVAWILPASKPVPNAVHRRLVRVCRISGVLALLAGVAWFVLQTAAIAGAEDLSDLLDALPVVAAHTRFGNILLARLGLVLVATILGCGGWRRYPCLLLSAIALGLQGMIGHAGATAGAIGDGLVLSEALHLVAAGLWLGALLPLCVSLRSLPAVQAALVAERFSPIGLGCVVVLAGSGFAQGFELIGSLPALFGTRYGQFAVLKITLFLIALALAAFNRLWLTDHLAAGRVSARRHMLVSVWVETLIGLAIVTAAAFMASSPPAAHTTPVWPFAWRFTLATVTEDADFRQEVIFSLLLIGGAAGLVLLTLLWRRFRLPALLVLALVVILRAPSLTLLTAEAYPTSFQTSPTGFAASSIVRGQQLYGPNCAGCHGADGQGNGVAAAGLRIKPADLTMPHLWEHDDGELFWWLSHGIDDPEGGLAMPGFAGLLPPEDRWALIDYIRAHNAGVALQNGVVTDLPIAAPGMPITCADRAVGRLTDLRGRFISVTAADTAGMPQPDAPVTTVLLQRDNDAGPPAGSCVSADPAGWDAFAVLANRPSQQLAGTVFLIDTGGWLRAMHRAGEAGGWQTPDDLPAAEAYLRSHPIQTANGDEHEHHH